MQHLLIICLTLFASLAIAAPEFPPQLPTPVMVATVVAKHWQPSVSAVGTLHAEQGIIIKPEISGRITRIYFRSGQEVKRGQPLLDINPDVLEAQLKLVEASLQLSKLAFEREQLLIKTNSISRADLDRSRAKYQSDIAALAKARAELAQAHIVAPFGGVLGLRNVSVGDYVTTGQSIVQLQDLDPIYVDFAIPERYVDQVRAKQLVRVVPDTMGKKVLIGKVLAVDASIDQKTRNIMVRAAVPNAQRILIPGAFVEVTLYLTDDQVALVVPKVAILYDREGAYVYVLQGDAVRKRRVVLGTLIDADAIITKGIQAGEKVITSGVTKLNDGAKVSVTNKG